MTHLGEGPSVKEPGQELVLGRLLIVLSTKIRFTMNGYKRSCSILGDIGLPLQEFALTLAEARSESDRNPFTFIVLKIGPKLTEFTYPTEIQLSIMSEL